MRRTELRQHAFKIIFQFPFHQDFDPEFAAEDYLSELSQTETLTDKDRRFILNEIKGALGYISESDKLISEHLSGWTFDRLNKIDLAILRLSLFEIACMDDIPPSVSINEAVELAKIFGGDDSPSFVNGILGKIAPILKAQGGSL